MKKIVYNTYEEMSSAAADLIAEQLKIKPETVFGFATGSTPEGLYNELIERVKKKKMDFTKAKAFNLDEYYPIAKTHPQSYTYYMNKNLFSKVKFASTDIPSGEADDPKAECARYDAAIKAAGGIDLQILGIGYNGHIGFNEPSKIYNVNTYLTELTQSTIEANSRFFKEGESQPATALTIGFGAIFNAKRIILLISGAGKAEIAKKLFEDKIYTDIPASLLKLHKNVTVLMDKPATGK